MTANANKAILHALLVAVATAAAISVVSLSQPASVEGQAQDITREISKEEFRHAQVQVLDLKADKNRLERLGEASGDAAAQRSEIDAKIAELMPVLDKYQQQRYAAYHIEPERKAYLERVESGLREAISEYDMDTWGVNLNSLTKTMVVIANDASRNDEIRALFDQYPDIPFRIVNGDFRVMDEACYRQTDDCDPIVGGIEIEGDCTLGLPVKKGTWPFVRHGYITAGHCIGDGQVLNQPNANSPAIGNNADSRIESDCDCAWVEKNTSTQSRSEIWRSPNNYLAVYNEMSTRPADGTNIVISGKTSGFMFGEVVEGNFNIHAGGIDWNLIRHDIDMRGGDSGSPVGDADASHIVGIHKGDIGNSNEMFHVASPWEAVDRNFSVQLYY